MRSVTPLDLRRSLGRILDETSAGERILIERNHKPLAVLISVEDAARLTEDTHEATARRQAAIGALEAWRERVLAGRPVGAPALTAAGLIRADRDEHTARDLGRVASRSADMER